MWCFRCSWKSSDVDDRGCWVDAFWSEASYSISIFLCWLTRSDTCLRTQLKQQFTFVLFIFRSTRMMIPFTSSSSPPSGLFWKFHIALCDNANANRARIEDTYILQYFYYANWIQNQQMGAQPICGSTIAWFSFRNFDFVHVCVCVHNGTENNYYF